jgi:hypothetical protein
MYEKLKVPTAYCGISGHSIRAGVGGRPADLQRRKP